MSKEEPFYKIPRSVAIDSRLNGNQKVLVAYLTSLSKQKGYAYASNPYLAREFSTTTRSVASWVSKLKDVGYIRVEQVGIERRIFMNKPSPPMKKTSYLNGSNPCSFLPTTHEENFLPPMKKTSYIIDKVNSDVELDKIKSPEDDFIKRESAVILEPEESKEIEANIFLDTRPLPSKSKSYRNRVPLAQEYSDHEAVALYRATFTRFNLKGKHLKRMESEIQDIPTWKGVLDYWDLNDHKPWNIAGLLSKYKQDIKRKANAQSRRKKSSPQAGVDPVRNRTIIEQALRSFNTGGA